MCGTKTKLKSLVGALAENLLPRLGSEIEDNRNTDRAARLKRLILHARAERARKTGNFAHLEDTLSSFWKGQTGDQFHGAYIEARFELFLKLHAYALDNLADALANTVPSVSRVIEIGCGDGQVLNHCRQKLPSITEFVGLDLNQAAIDRATRAFATSGAELRFVTRDALHWLPQNPKTGTAIITNGGVLEYFSQNSVSLLLETLAKSAPCAALLIEPLAPEHDLNSEVQSYVFGRENSFSHNYPYLLRQAGFDVDLQDEIGDNGIRWCVVLATKP